jgi:hypothetical protein
MTGFTDAVSGTAGPEDVQLWGGLVINGNGRTNKCSDAQATGNGCHVLSEGKPSNYGGNDNAESSGSLRYVVVKHTGFEVAPGDELNGITFNAVGSGTTVSHVQAYSTYDDGFEFFGGAVNVDHAILVYVKDDSIDYADGWVGTITHALVIHSSTDGNRCIEGDNQGTDFAALPQTNPTVSNMTCITSGSDQSGGGTHGDSEGILLRAGVQSQIQDSIVYDGYARTVLSRDGNECMEFNDDATMPHAVANITTMKSTLIACQNPAQGALAPASTDTAIDWVNGAGPQNTYPNNTNNVILTASDSPNVAVLGGAKPFFTATQFTDDTGTAFTITPVGSGPLGAVTAADDWTANWAFGLDALWF